MPRPSGDRPQGWLAFERAYARAIRPRRLWLADVRAAFEGLADDRVAQDSLVLELADAHREACRAAFRSAVAEAGTSWLTGVGIALPDEVDRLWAEHGTPLTGVSPERLADARRAGRAG